jgi:hypothetical protein
MDENPMDENPVEDPNVEMAGEMKVPREMFLEIIAPPRRGFPQGYRCPNCQLVFYGDKTIQ